MSTDPTTAQAETAPHLEWPEKHACHQDAPRYLDHPIGNWRAPREGEQTFRTCDYCGSMDPKALFEALQTPTARLELADMKYGWPHKFYVHGIPHPQGGEQWAGLDANGAPLHEPRSQHAKFYNIHLTDLPPTTFQALTDLIAKRTNIRFQMDPKGLMYGPEIAVTTAPAPSPAS